METYKIVKPAIHGLIWIVGLFGICIGAIIIGIVVLWPLTGIMLIEDLNITWKYAWYVYAILYIPWLYVIGKLIE